MKIRNKRLLAAAGWTGATAARALVRSLRFEYRCLGPTVVPLGVVPPGPRYAYALWHEYLLLPTVRFSHPDGAAMVSKHADGHYVEALLKAGGMGTVLGSTNRGGVEAVRFILNDPAARRHLVVTVDGPRGPRREVQPGIVYIASRAGMEIVPIGVGFQRPWRAGSWDKFAVPKPGSRAKAILGVPFAVPARLKTAELEPYVHRLQSEMDRLTAAAERWAETNRLDLPAAEPAPLRLAS